MAPRRISCTALDSTPFAKDIDFHLIFAANNPILQIDGAFLDIIAVGYESLRVETGIRSVIWRRCWLSPRAAHWLAGCSRTCVISSRTTDVSISKRKV
jgi:hypothetical protein